MLKLIPLCGIAAVFLMGCASVVHDTTHSMRIDAKSPTGELVKDARCTASNDYGAINVKSGEMTNVRRSSEDLKIVCLHDSYPDAHGRAISRVNGGMAGSVVVFGGGLGYAYPTWVELVYGKRLVFDRAEENEGIPLVGRK
jgi:hypothetical protein